MFPFSHPHGTFFPSRDDLSIRMRTRYYLTREINLTYHRSCAVSAIGAYRVFGRKCKCRFCTAPDTYVVTFSNLSPDNVLINSMVCIQARKVWKQCFLMHSVSGSSSAPQDCQVWYPIVTSSAPHDCVQKCFVSFSPRYVLRGSDLGRF